MTKKVISLLLVLMMISNVSYAAGFSDVASTCWAYIYVNECQQNKLLDGYPDGTFKGQNTLKANEFLKILATYYSNNNNLTIGSQKSGESWFGPYYEVCKKIGLIDGSKSEGEYGYNLSREEATYYMYIFVGKRTAGECTEYAEQTFKDQTDMSEKYKVAITDMSKKKFIIGNPDGNFYPKNTLTRYEASKLIHGLTVRGISLKGV